MLSALVSDFRDQRGAVHVAFDLSRLRDAFDGVDAADHRGGDEGQLGGLAGEALAVGDSQQIRSEFVDLFEQPRLAGGGQAEHGNDRGDPDRDPQRGERRAQSPRAQPHARHAGEVGAPQPPGCEVRGARVCCSAVGDDAHRASLGLAGSFVDERERRRSGGFDAGHDDIAALRVVGGEGGRDGDPAGVGLDR